MKQKRIPGICRHKPTGLAYCRLGGRTIYLGPADGPDVQARYDAAVAEWLSRGRARQQPFGPLVVDVIAAYWEHVTRYYRKPNGTATSEVESNRKALRYVQRLYGEHPASDFGAMALKACREAMILAGHCRTSINRDVGRVKRMFRWAASEEMVPAAVLPALDAVSGLREGRSEAREFTPVMPVDDFAVAAVLPLLNRQLRCLVELQALTGARSGELLALRPRDIDFTADDVWLYKPTDHKCRHHGRERVIPFGPKCQALIRPFLSGRPLDACLFSPAEADAERRAEQHAARKTAMSCGNVPGSNRRKHPRKQPGESYSVLSYGRAIAEAVRKYNRRAEADGRPVIPHWSPHRLRHSYGTKVRAAAGLETARAALGHATVSATQVYAEVDQQRVRDLAARIG